MTAVERAEFALKADVTKYKLREALLALVEEAKDRERLLVIASDYLSQHWDMDSAPLNEIAEAATQSDQEGEGGD